MQVFSLRDLVFCGQCTMAINPLAEVLANRNNHERWFKWTVFGGKKGICTGPAAW
jgi:hypothetical protein